MGTVVWANKGTSGFGDGSISTEKLADDSVTNAKLNNITRGSVKVGGASDAPTDYDAKTSGQILVGDGTDVVSVVVSDDIALASDGTMTIQADSVENTMLANITRGSVKVGGASDAPTDYDAKTSGQVLVGDGTDIVSVAVSGDLALASDGTMTIQVGAVEDSMIEALTAGQIILGVDGTAANNLKAVLSGDVAMDATGAVTIASGAVEESMIAVPNVDALNTKRIARATYSYAEHGGAVSTIGLGVTLPDNAIVTRTYYEVITTLTSNAGTDGATVSFDIPTDDVGGLVAPLAISAGGNIWDAGYHEGIQDGTAAAFSVKTTAARELSVTIGVEAIDAAGIVVFFCEYVVTE